MSRWFFRFAGVCGVGIIFILPETYVPYILHTEAARLRKESKFAINFDVSLPFCLEADINLYDDFSGR